jgi:hypothetical protein
VTPGTFILETCPLCNGDAGCLSIAVPRPTAAPRVLVFDGGGNRVIIGLEVLRLLAQEVPVPGFVHRMFDIVTGTSSGKSPWLGWETTTAELTLYRRWVGDPRPVRGALVCGRMSGNAAEPRLAFFHAQGRLAHPPPIEHPVFCDGQSNWQPLSRGRDRMRSQTGIWDPAHPGR